MHEAGHAVAASVLGYELEGVDIKRRPLPGGGESVGFTACKVKMPRDFAGEGEEAAVPQLIQTFAGPLSELFISDLHDEILSGAGGDQDVARTIAVVATCPVTSREGDRCEISSQVQAENRGRIAALLDRGYEAARCFVNENRLAIFAVAEALVERRVLTGAEVAAIVAASKATDAETSAETN